MYQQVANQLFTIRDVLRFAVSHFRAAGLHFGHGSQSAWDEAVYLILHTLHLPIDELNPYLDARLTHAEMERVLGVLQQRIEKRTPAAYLTGEAWLGEFRFSVDPRVIVPRSFIAELLFEGLSPWVDAPENIGHVLDLCTGSGCLAIIAAHVFGNAAVDAIDLSADALAVAHLNVDAYGLGESLRLLQSDVYEALGHEQYDLILSNPPYVNADSMAALPAEYRAEPQMALAGGGDGLDIVRRILHGAAARLHPAGLIIIEVGHERDHVEAAFPDMPCTWLTTSAGDDMVFMLRREELVDYFGAHEDIRGNVRSNA